MYRLFDYSVATNPKHWFFRVCLCVLLCAVSICAASLPPGFSESQFGGAGANIANPTAMAFAPDGRLFVCQQTGQLRVIRNGVLLPTPFLTLAVDSSGERGLLGVAFDPNFASNQFVYVYYTTSTAPIHNRVSRFQANVDVALMGSETIILELNNLSGASNHNGGAIHFGLDGKLYIAVGENANPANAQTLGNLLGKMLRINPDGTIPQDNPFLQQTTGNNQAIWALGLRNPFTFGIQPNTGRIFINDVGQSAWEEINDGLAGRNYGWSTCEGNCNPPDPRFTDPLYQYNHINNQCAIVGAAFYNPAVRVFPTYYIGKYFFADLCAGWIHYIDPASPQTAFGFATGLSTPVDLLVGPDGALYYLQIGNGGQVRRVTYTLTALRKSNFDGDTAADLATWRGNEGNWYILQSGNGSSQTIQWGAAFAPYNDLTAPGDYDGDGRADTTVFRRQNGVWFIRRSSDGVMATTQWGVSTDTPVPGDYDGDGKTDIAVWRGNEGNWYILRSSTGTVQVTQWGQANSPYNDVPVAADYDGDGITDIAVYRRLDGRWYIRRSSDGVIQIQQWGISSDIPVPGDYDGDGKADIAVWRGNEGNWYIVRSSSGAFQVIQWGAAFAPYNDIPVPADYDGDGKVDIAVWRPLNAIWFIINSSNGQQRIQQWGASGDIPVPATGIR